MACHAVTNCNLDGAKTRRSINATQRRIQQVETAKTLVCGVPSDEALKSIRLKFEELLPLLEEGARHLNSGYLDDCSDDELREIATALQNRDLKMASILEGSERIGLPGIEPFPRYLESLRVWKDRFQSQLEGILLSLNDSFPEVLEKSAQDIRAHV
jgi:hypothetical protein